MFLMQHTIVEISWKGDVNKSRLLLPYLNSHGSMNGNAKDGTVSRKCEELFESAKL